MERLHDSLPLFRMNIRAAVVARKNQLSGILIHIDPEVYFTLRIRMFEGIAEQIADDFFNLVSVEDRIVGIC